MDHAIVMAGGSGTRFWPESRLRRSKQFLNLTGDGPMIVETVRRLFPLVPRENVWVVAGEKDAPHLKARTLGVPPRNILLEPQGRNTAPAVALAALIIERRDQDAVIAATPADHAVADAASFRSTLRKGFRLARSTGRFVTLGITPAHPATGYGYIERGAPYRRGGKGVYLVRRNTRSPYRQEVFSRGTVLLEQRCLSRTCGNLPQSNGPFPSPGSKGAGAGGP
jgi:mannose-1-phosphate guanylyltransferase